VTQTILKKICLLGDFAVGKTSLIRRYVDNQLSDDYLSTIGVKLSRKKIEVPAQLVPAAMELIIWDLEGKVNFSESFSPYLKGASGAIVVGDVTRPDSITNIKNHINAFLSVNPRASVCVAYNKTDLLDGTAAPSLDFEGHDRVVKTHRTSAKSGDGVTELFESLSKKIISA